MDAPIRIIVLMGPAGAGKTTTGLALAQSLGWRFLDADDFHSAANVEKMRRGVALTDDDRAPWLAAMQDVLERALATDTSIVLACSALKERYRRALTPTAAGSQIRFVYLQADEVILRERLAHRTGHYAGTQLLASQLETLEEPRDALWVDASRPPAEIVSRIRDALAL